MARFKLVNLKGDLFATGATFFAQAVVKLGSSLVLTRILRPEAYGIVTILLSITFVIEMLSDIAVTVPIVRHDSGDNPLYLNTAWTLRLVRSLLNAVIVFLCAPLIAKLYDVNGLEAPLRVFALFFLFAGLESMSFPIAIRRKNSRIIVYSELVVTFLSTLFTITYCYFFPSFWGMLYGILLNRLLLSASSHFFYRELRPRVQVDWPAARELLKYSRFALPSSILGLCLTQFDKVVFLRLFDLRLLGIYALANNIVGPIENLVQKISQLVLYPRCAEAYRDHRDNFTLKYYTDNAKLFFGILLIPAAVGGAAHLIIGVMYDPRYAQAASVLQAFMGRAALLSLAAPAEDMLIASGEFQVILIGNILRAAWIVGAALGGYYLFGFMGFVWGTALSGLPPLLYYLWLQRKKGFLIVRYEIYKVAFAASIAVLAYLASSLLLMLLPTLRTIV
jgi:lipopolysaccharide exporter